MNHVHDDTSTSSPPFADADLIVQPRTVWIALVAQMYTLQAYQDALHAHGIVISSTITGGTIAWAAEQVPPRQPMDAPDLPSPYESLRLALYAGIQLLRS